MVGGLGWMLRGVFVLLCLLAGGRMLAGETTHRVEWRHEVLVDLDKPGQDYEATGWTVDFPASRVYHRASYASSEPGQPYLSSVEYTPLDFPVVRRPAWLFPEEDGRHLALRTSRGQRHVDVNLPLFVLRGGQLLGLSSYTLAWRAVRGGPITSGSEYVGAARSVLATGEWVKISVEQSGVYRLDYRELAALGIGDPAQLSVWGNDGHALSYMNSDTYVDDLRQLPVEWHAPGGVIGPGAFALVYLGGPEWYEYDKDGDIYRYRWSDYFTRSHYFITMGRPTLGVQTAVPLPADHTQEGYWALRGYRDAQINLTETGRDWLSLPFNLRRGQRLDLELDDPEPGRGARVGLHMAVSSPLESSFSISMNGQPVGTLPAPAIPVWQSVYRLATRVDGVFASAELPSTGRFSLGLEYVAPTAGSNAWVRWVDFNVRQMLRWRGSPFEFFSDAVGTPGQGNRLRLLGAEEGLEVWDVDDPFATRRYGSPDEVVVDAASRRHMVVFNPRNARRVRFEGRVDNQDLHGTTEVPNLLIISHPRFLAQAEQAADIYRTSPWGGLRVQVVDADAVYNEFASGNRDVSAIRNYARMLYWRGGGGAPGNPFRYLLLVGKPHYKTWLGSQEGNQLPNFQSSASFDKSECYATDDYFGIFDPDEGDGDGGLDVGVGRYSVSNVADMANLLTHERAYHNPANWSDWLVRGVSMGDDRDGLVHMAEADALADAAEGQRPAVMMEKLLYDRYEKRMSYEGGKYPSVTERLNAAVEEGASWINYVGHAASFTLSTEAVLLRGTGHRWMNLRHLPILCAASCHFACNDIPDQEALGEELVILPAGGAIGVVAANRISYSRDNNRFNRALIEGVYSPASTDQMPTLGDALRQAKVGMAAVPNKRRYALLGNPALPLPRADARAALQSYQGHAPAQPADPPEKMEGLEPIELVGDFRYADGSPIERGVAYVTVKSPQVERETLNTEGQGALKYKTREAILFRGKARIRDGRGTIRFITPMDLPADKGLGLISLMGVGDRGVSQGSYQHFEVGGLFAGAGSDTEGPGIDIRLGDGSRRDGKIVVGSQVELRLLLRDSSGINVSGAGVGHGLMVYLEHDGEVSAYDLNASYLADEDTYTRGQARYMFHGLTPGNYRLRARACDVYNNCSEEVQDFEVAHAESPRLSNLLNYPNPFTGHTAFYFDWTRPGEACDVSIQIYTVDGELVRDMQFRELAPSFRLGPYWWDGLDAWGRKLGRGVYFYRVYVRVRKGWSVHQEGAASGYGKLLKL